MNDANIPVKRHFELGKDGDTFRRRGDQWKRSVSRGRGLVAVKVWEEKREEDLADAQKQYPEAASFKSAEPGVFRDDELDPFGTGRVPGDLTDIVLDADGNELGPFERRGTQMYPKDWIRFDADMHSAYEMFTAAVRGKGQIGVNEKLLERALKIVGMWEKGLPGSLDYFDSWYYAHSRADSSLDAVDRGDLVVSLQQATAVKFTNVWATPGENESYDKDEEFVKWMGILGFKKSLSKRPTGDENEDGKPLYRPTIEYNTPTRHKSIQPTKLEREEEAAAAAVAARQKREDAATEAALAKEEEAVKRKADLVDRKRELELTKRALEGGRTVEEQRKLEEKDKAEAEAKDLADKADAKKLADVRKQADVATLIARMKMQIEDEQNDLDAARAKKAFLESPRESTTTQGTYAERQAAAARNKERDEHKAAKKKLDKEIRQLEVYEKRAAQDPLEIDELKKKRQQEEQAQRTTKVEKDLGTRGDVDPTHIEQVRDKSEKEAVESLGIPGLANGDKTIDEAKAEAKSNLQQAILDRDSDAADEWRGHLNALDNLKSQHLTMGVDADGLPRDITGFAQAAQHLEGVIADNIHKEMQSGERKLFGEDAKVQASRIIKAVTDEAKKAHPGDIEKQNRYVAERVAQESAAISEATHGVALPRIEHKTVDFEGNVTTTSLVDITKTNWKTAKWAMTAADLDKLKHFLGEDTTMKWVWGDKDDPKPTKPVPVVPLPVDLDKPKPKPSPGFRKEFPEAAELLEPTEEEPEPEPEPDKPKPEQKQKRGPHGHPKTTLTEPTVDPEDYVAAVESAQELSTESTPSVQTVDEPVRTPVDATEIDALNDTVEKLIEGQKDLEATVNAETKPEPEPEPEPEPKTETASELAEIIGGKYEFLRNHVDPYGEIGSNKVDELLTLAKDVTPTSIVNFRRRAWDLNVSMFYQDAILSLSDMYTRMDALKPAPPASIPEPAPAAAASDESSFSSPGGGVRSQYDLTAQGLHPRSEGGGAPTWPYVTDETPSDTDATTATSQPTVVPPLQLQSESVTHRPSNLSPDTISMDAPFDNSKLPINAAIRDSNSNPLSELRETPLPRNMNDLDARIANWHGKVGAAREDMGLPVDPRFRGDDLQDFAGFGNMGLPPEKKKRKPSYAYGGTSISSNTF